MGDEQEFREHFQEWSDTNPGVKARDANEFASQLFQTFDKDGSGEIDFSEYVCFLALKEHGSEIDKLRWIFRMYDTDNSGKITIDELRAIVKLSYSMMGKQAAGMGESWQHLADRLFEEMDTEDLREIHIESFIDTAQTNPQFHKILQLVFNM